VKIYELDENGKGTVIGSVVLDQSSSSVTIGVDDQTVLLTEGKNYSA